MFGKRKTVMKEDSAMNNERLFCSFLNIFAKRKKNQLTALMELLILSTTSLK